MKSTINLYSHPPAYILPVGVPFTQLRLPITLDRLGLFIKLTRVLSNLLSSISYGDRGLSPPPRRLVYLIPTMTRTYKKNGLNPSPKLCYTMKARTVDICCTWYLQGNSICYMVRRRAIQFFCDSFLSHPQIAGYHLPVTTSERSGLVLSSSRL
jgi:hypothetical protein